jgi:hypothetical protein
VLANNLEDTSSNEDIHLPEKLGANTRTRNFGERETRFNHAYGHSTIFLSLSVIHPHVTPVLYVDHKTMTDQ